MPKKKWPSAAVNSARPDDWFDAPNLAQLAPADLIPKWRAPSQDHLAAIQETLPIYSSCGAGVYFHGIHLATKEEFLRWRLGWIAYACCFYCLVDRDTPKRILAYCEFLFSRGVRGRVQ